MANVSESVSESVTENVSESVSESVSENVPEHSEKLVLSRKEIFIYLKDDIYCPISKAYEKIENLISTKLKCPYKLTDKMKKIFQNLFYSYRRKCRTVKKSQILNKYDKWLNVKVTFYNPTVALNNINNFPTENYNTLSKIVHDSNNSKRRKIEEIPSCSYVIELPRVSQSSSDNLNKENSTKVMRDATRKADNYKNYNDTSITDDYALSLLLEIQLSKNQYEVLRSTNIENNCHIYPSYKSIQQAKEKCYPTKTDIKIKDCSAEVTLQGLLDHTIEQLLFYRRDFIKSSPLEYINNMTLYCKWGSSESLGENLDKQNFNINNDNVFNSSLFSISIVPLKIISNNQISTEEYTIWENQSPFSSRFCRPIKVQFYPINKHDYVTEINYIKSQETKLIPFITVFDGKMISVSYNLKFVITDTQVCNKVKLSLLNNNCFLCNASEEEFNDINTALKRKVDQNNCFGLSMLHIWVRFFECCLDLSYKLDIKKSNVTETEKLMLENRKRNVQRGLNLQYKFTIDIEKLELKNYDENTARQFLENSTTSALITGVDRIIIKRFYVILQAISSNYKINTTKFHEYAVKTARRFVKLYPWYNMSTTIHKILIHGPEISQFALLPIGQLCSNIQKNLCVERSYQNIFRVKNMEEVFLELLALSDPYISSLRNIPQTKLKDLMTETINLLILPDNNEILSDDDSDDSDSDE